nr:hypothetical protein HmN_000683900 [Hymenolepis microstoma]
MGDISLAIHRANQAFEVWKMNYPQASTIDPGPEVEWSETPWSSDFTPSNVCVPLGLLELPIFDCFPTVKIVMLCLDVIHGIILPNPYPLNDYEILLLVKENL